MCLVPYCSCLSCGAHTHTHTHTHPIISISGRGDVTVAADVSGAMLPLLRPTVIITCYSGQQFRQVAERQAQTAFCRVCVRAQEEFMDVTRRMSLHETHTHTHTHKHCRQICDKMGGSGFSATSVPRDAHPTFTGFLGLRHICTTLLELQRTQFQIIYIHDVH